MKAFFNKLKDVAIAGFLFLLPVFVVFIVITKAWQALTSLGTRVASMFGMKTIVGIGSATIFTSLLLIIICLLCGYLVLHFAVLKRFNQSVEKRLMKYIPGYTTYKQMAEEKLQPKEKLIPYTPALLKMDNNFLQPVFIIEKGDSDNDVILVPAIPETNKGQILIVKEDRLTRITSVTANQFDDALKSLGAGLLSKRMCS
jgi:uncharacterized membrane protein